MDIDEFLDREITAQNQEQNQNKPQQSDNLHQSDNPQQYAANISKEQPKETITFSSASETGAVKDFLELWKKVFEAKFKWDEKLYNDLSAAGEKAREQTDKEEVNADRQKKAIKRLIGQALDEIEKKNYDVAAKLYSEISDMQDKIPDFMMEEKKSLNGEIFLLYEKLHNEMDKKFIKDFRDSLSKTENYIKDSALCFDANDLDKAKAIYGKALQEFHALPSGFLNRKLEIGSSLLKLYKDLSIQTQINELQQQLSSRPSINHQTLTYDRLRELSEKIDTREISSLHNKLYEEFKLNQHIPNKTLLSRLIARKIDRAKVNIKKELYTEAKRNLESVLRVDPENSEAKKLLGSIPIKI